ncbi:hypothetical protein E2562_024635 [Oryza meyeriana var. granulata]|uniref:C2H2-type domain-containing protein n=1 Tax=Oryza meyeriana var. granulata TaxID=110450 RepID=A0A6G1DMQ1_9ORYZ|nr:hypothetical protein E2562_024635 [Oryza meyeriana var. granulata]
MESGGDKESIRIEAAVGSPGQQEVAAGAALRGEDDAAAVTTSPAAAASARPYYECVFCKRGFTTAQALGGHMNIHRRHRDRANKPSGRRDTPTVYRDVECYNQHPYLAYPAPPPSPALPATPPMSSSFATHYTDSTAATATVAGSVDGEVMRPAGSPSLIRELKLFGGADTRDHDLHLRLGRHGRGGDTPEGSPELLSGELPERKLDLDLELRLGRRPRH